MIWLIPLVAKSLLIAGGALVPLHLMRDRSAADRSWVAHLALGALLLLPLASLGPSLDVQGPEWLVGKSEAPIAAPAGLPDQAEAVTTIPVSADQPVAAPASGFGLSSFVSGVDWPFWTYVLPAAVLILLTLIALARLFVLKTRASVLIDAPWLTALAKAQQRMGFKHGTALLTSDALPSPISWGVVRPVILLNSEAAKSHDEAEAIITHELAHVARLDWAKLMLARLAVALFWFNPLVWMLAREAHQLREEAADDAVLATDIDDTDYAKLLVGVARHECRGLLLGAHGVAPARNSLARRVKRVLDGAVARAPGGWRWSSAAAFFAAGMAVPVAALNFVPPVPVAAAEIAAPAPVTQPARILEPLPVAEPIESASPDPVATVAAVASQALTADIRNQIRDAAKRGQVMQAGNQVLINAPDKRIIVEAPDSTGRSRVMIQGPDGQSIVFAGADAYASASGAVARATSRVDDLVARKALGVSPDYVKAMRSALPHLRLDEDELLSARALGVTPDYARSMAGAGYSRLSLDDLNELRVIGVRASDVAQARRDLGRLPSVEEMIEIKAVGFVPDIALDDPGPP